jgi:hypothetical protein
MWMCTGHDFVVHSFVPFISFIPLEKSQWLGQVPMPSAEW